MLHNTSYQNKLLIIVAGPTAVGKTAVSMELAKTWKADIFSADSRQIYKEMNTGTAKPSLENLLEITHHFINHISIHQKYSVGQYVEEMRSELAKYFRSHEVAILTGGTGLYIKSLLDGIDQFPDVPQDILDHYNYVFSTNGLEYLQQELQVADPAYFASVDIDNPRRLIRALSVIRASGQTYSSFLSAPKDHLPYRICEILLDLPREVLYERINRRVDMMIAEGLEHESKELHKYRGIPALETVGYQEFFDFFENKTTKSEAIESIKQNSRRYAKRQLTWFRKYGNWQVFSQNELAAIEQYVREFANNVD